MGGEEGGGGDGHCSLGATVAEVCHATDPVHSGGDKEHVGEGIVEQLRDLRDPWPGAGQRQGATRRKPPPAGSGPRTGTSRVWNTPLAAHAILNGACGWSEAGGTAPRPPLRDAHADGRKPEYGGAKWVPLRRNAPPPRCEAQQVRKHVAHGGQDGDDLLHA